MLYNVLENLPIRHYVVPIEDVRYNSIWVHHVASRTPNFEVVKHPNNPLVIQLFRFVYKVCAYLPAIGLLTAFLPDLHEGRGQKA